MFIELPKEYYFENSSCCVYMDNDLLKIKNKGEKFSFGKIMYNLTFKMKGYTCYYCGSKKDITIDHMHPRSRGGPTITNNLQPACRSCNAEKDILNDVEYKFFLSLEPETRKEFKKDVKTSTEIMSKWHGFYKEMPQEWFIKINIKKIKTRANKKSSRQITSKVRYQKIKNSILKQKECIVIDKNNVLLYGLEEYFVAKHLKVTEVSVVKIENVEIVF